MDEFVQVRRKDDPDVILPQPLAKSALPYFPDWEPIPAEPTSEPAEPAATEAAPPDEQAPEPTRRTRRSARKASTDTTETEGEAGHG